jgi:2,3-diketo-5-methylthiopentyl-1-phosphate enolase
MSYAMVLGSLMRLGGADMTLFPSSYGTVALPHADTMDIKKALVAPQGDLKRSFPAPSAGIHPGLVPKIVADYGHDVIINAGGGVHGHPQGARAGAKAFRQAVNWISSGRKDFSSLAQTLYPELTAALKLWGRG